MAYTYHGVELVNCSPPRRRGPLTHFPQGQYKGQRIEDVIRRNPNYVMWAVKEWLDLTPSQAGLFEAVTGGGIIPDRYIKESPPKVISPIREKQESPPKKEKDSPESAIGWLTWGPDGIDEVNNPGKTIPNYDFDPDMAPDWWPRFKKECEGKNALERYDIYERYRNEELKEMKVAWEKEYQEYRKTHKYE